MATLAKSLTQADKDRLAAALKDAQAKGEDYRKAADRLDVSRYTAQYVYSRGTWPQAHRPGNNFYAVRDPKLESRRYRELKVDPAYVEVAPRHFMKREVVERYPFFATKYRKQLKATR